MSVLLEDNGYPVPINLKYEITPEDLAEAEKALAEFKRKINESEHSTK